MIKEKVEESIKGTSASTCTYTAYCAGGLFTQDELATNIFLKEAIWRLSKGKFQLVLPQSRELQELDRSNLEAFIRNDDLLQVITADIILARFDGLELDSGTVVEFLTAKFLGKPSVILRTDFRSVTFIDDSKPYNLMVKNWPRSTTVHIHSYMAWAEIFEEVRKKNDFDESEENKLRDELDVIPKSFDQAATKIIHAMETVIGMNSPYPPEFQKLVYRAVRYGPGSGFDEILSERELEKLIQRLSDNGTL